MTHIKKYHCKRQNLMSHDSFCTLVYECPSKQRHREEGGSCFKDSICGYRSFYEKYGTDVVLGIGAMTAEGLEAIK